MQARAFIPALALKGRANLIAVGVIVELLPRPPWATEGAPVSIA
jgi:hypothetical protein